MKIATLIAATIAMLMFGSPASADELPTTPTAPTPVERQPVTGCYDVPPDRLYIPERQCPRPDVTATPPKRHRLGCVTPPRGVVVVPRPCPTTTPKRHALPPRWPSVPGVSHPFASARAGSARAVAVLPKLVTVWNQTVS